MNEQVRREWLDLLKEEIHLVQVEEMLLNNGDPSQAMEVRKERDLIFQEREALKRRMDFQVIAS